jgi:hypothetical protein
LPGGKKERGSGKGNLAEANVKEWSETVRKAKEKYPKVKNEKNVPQAVKKIPKTTD